MSLDTSLIENAGLWRAKLQLSPEDGELPNAIIETVAQVRDPVVATPKQVGLGRVPCGGSSQQVVTVSINATATRILAVRSSDDRLTPRLLIGETGGTATVNVEWIPDVPGLFKGAVVIDTDNPLPTAGPSEVGRPLFLRRGWASSPTGRWRMTCRSPRA